MNKKYQVKWYLSGIIFVFILIGCTTIPILTIEYRLPEQVNHLSGKAVYLAFADQRTPKELFSRAAQNEFGSSVESVSFYLAKNTESSFKMGIYELPALFMDVFKRRLQNLGMEVLSEKKDTSLIIEIGLKKFLLDFSGRDWKAQVAYEARLIKEGQVLARQNISSEGTRLKLIGTTQANILMSELFTEMVNKLDINQLYEQAGLK